MKNAVCVAEVERERRTRRRRGGYFMWQHAGVILSCLCKLGETHRLQSRRSNTSVSESLVSKGGVVCVKNIKVCLVLS